MIRPFGMSATILVSSWACGEPAAPGSARANHAEPPTIDAAARTVDGECGSIRMREAAEAHERSGRPTFRGGRPVDGEYLLSAVDWYRSEGRGQARAIDTAHWNGGLRLAAGHFHLAATVPFAPGGMKEGALAVEYSASYKVLDRALSMTITCPSAHAGKQGKLPFEASGDRIVVPFEQAPSHTTVLTFTRAR
jgi:hypothetical protein